LGLLGADGIIFCSIFNEPQDKGNHIPNSRIFGGEADNAMADCSGLDEKFTGNGGLGAKYPPCSAQNPENDDEKKDKTSAGTAPSAVAADGFMNRREGAFATGIRKSHDRQKKRAKNSRRPPYFSRVEYLRGGQKKVVSRFENQLTTEGSQDSPATTRFTA
jgi:hypothetical protein